MHVHAAKKEVSLKAGRIYYFRAELGGVLVSMPDWQAVTELRRFRLPRKRR